MVLDTVKKKTKAAYSRIVFSRTTVAFVVFSFLLCLVQGIIQSLLFTVDSEYHNLLRNITQTVILPPWSNITEIPSEIHIQHIALSSCNDIPTHANRAQNCSVIFDTDFPDPTTSQPAVMLNQIAFSPKSHVVEVANGTGVPEERRKVSERCAQTLLYAQQTLRNFSREDLTFVFLQFWLFGISVLAVTNDSIAHLLTTVMAHALLIAWSIYSFWRTQNFPVIFHKLYVDPGTPCNIDFSPNFWKTRLVYQIMDLVLTIIGYTIALWLSWKLLCVYNSQALRYVGAPQHINHINKLFLAVLSCLQLEGFIIMTAMGLWIDVLQNTAISQISLHTKIYMNVFILTSLALVPWISLGWYSIRREMRKTILLFIFLAIMIVAGWSAMFDSLVYRWTFSQWPLLGGASAGSLFLSVSIIVLAIICRLNFGKGLKQYLQAEAALAKSGFSPEVFSHDEEKNTPLDIEAADLKQLSFSPTSPTTKYEHILPTYPASSVPHSRSGSVEMSTAEGRRANALEAPLRVSRLVERQTRMPVHGTSYEIKLGESF